MFDMTDEVRKAITAYLKYEGITIKKYYGEVKEQGFETPCIMIAPMGDSGTKTNYELDGFQMRNYGYQILYFPEEVTVFKGSTLNQRKACEIVADALLCMRYIGTVATMNNPRYSIQDGTLIFTFTSKVRGLVREDRPFIEELEENVGGLFGRD